MAKITLQDALEKGYDAVRGSDSFEQNIMNVLPQRVENQIRDVLHRESELGNSKWILEDLANDGKIQGQHGYSQADMTELAKIGLTRAEAAKITGRPVAANDGQKAQPSNARPSHDCEPGEAHHHPSKPAAQTAAQKAPKAVDSHHEGHSAHAPGEGDIPVFDAHASGHIGPSHGRTLNANELDSIGRTLGLPSAAQLVPSLDANGAYNPGQTDQQKRAGAYLALSTVAKFKTMPPSNFPDEKTAARAYGNLKIKAKEGDAKGVRDILKKHGGDAGGLSDQQLTNLWSGNEHQNLHGILFGNSKIYNPIHATSLNDNDKTGSGERTGGFNDKGEYPQWGWFGDAQSFNQRVLGNAGAAPAPQQRPVMQQAPAQTPAAEAQPKRETPRPAQTPPKAGSAGGGEAKMSGQPQSLAQWGDMVAAAAKASGVPAAILAGQIWAESRGRVHTDTQNPDGKTRDVGVMQIGQERWQRDVVTKLTDAQKASINQVTGVDAANLDMSNPLHNVVGGAFHLLNWRNGAYGQPAAGDWGKALNGYVNGDINTPRSIGPSNYSDLVRGYAQMVVDQVPLRLEDYQHPTLFG